MSRLLDRPRCNVGRWDPSVRYLQTMATIPRATRANDEGWRRHHPGSSALLFAFCLSACSGEPATPAKWTGTDGNLEVNLTLTISRDSLSGHGTYTARAPEEIRCGGGVLAQ